MPTPQQTPLKRSVAFTLFMLIGSLFAFMTAYLLIEGRYLELFGYRTVAENIPAAGAQVWGLEQVFVLMTLCLFLSAIVCALYQRKFGLPVVWWQAILGFAALIFCLVTFFPPPFEFQLRYYDGPAYITYVFLSKDSAGFVGAKRTAFAGSAEVEGLDVYYNEAENEFENRQFVCISERAWWWGNVTVSRSFHPILDHENQRSLLKKYCKPITDEEAVAKGF